jgi:hypothetical protein
VQVLQHFWDGTWFGYPRGIGGRRLFAVHPPTISASQLISSWLPFRSLITLPGLQLLPGLTPRICLVPRLRRDLFAPQGPSPLQLISSCGFHLSFVDYPSRFAERTPVFGLCWLHQIMGNVASEEQQKSTDKRNPTSNGVDHSSSQNLITPPGKTQLYLFN